MEAEEIESSSCIRRSRASTCVFSSSSRRTLIQPTDSKPTIDQTSDIFILLRLSPQAPESNRILWQDFGRYQPTLPNLGLPVSRQPLRECSQQLKFCGRIFNVAFRPTTTRNSGTNAPIDAKFAPSLFGYIIVVLPAIVKRNSGRFL